MINALEEPEMIGRGHELSVLNDKFQSTLKERGNTVFIAGEAGIGKTRLVSELIGHAEKEGAQAIKGWCLAGNLEPLMPVREALRNAGLYHLVSGKPPPRVISAYLIHAGGILVSKAERKTSELDGDIFASMLDAVGNFVTDSLSMMGKGGTGLNEIGYGKYTILIETLESTSLACVIEGTQNEFLIDDMQRMLREIGSRLDDWDGDTSKVEDLEESVSWFISSKKYDGEFLVDDPKLKQENLFDNVLMGIQRAATENPLILFIDDLQWADQTTLNLLHYLARNTRENRVLILGTYRPEDVLKLPNGRSHMLELTMQNMSREDLLENINLQRLGVEHTGKVIRSALGSKISDLEFVEKIHEETGGNPFFILEVMKLLSEDGSISINSEDGFTCSEHIGDLNIPSKVYDVIKRRLNRLKEEQIDILECGSIEGDVFRSEVVGRVLELNRLKLLKDLSEIENKHKLIHSMGKKYHFDHAKISEVLYNGMMEELRQEYHRLVGDTIEDIYQESIEEVVNELAHHYYKASDEKAPQYLIQAGDRAKESYANAEALHLYELALDIFEDDKKVVMVSESIGDVKELMGFYDDAIDLFQRAAELTKDIETKARNLRKTAEVYHKMGDITQSEDVIKKIKSFFVTNRAAELGRISVLEGDINYRKGNLDRAMKLLSESIDIFNEVGGDKDMGNALRTAGNIHLYRGEDDKALEQYEKSLTVMKNIGDMAGIAAALNNIGIISLNTSDWESALELYQGSLEIEEKIGNKWGMARSLNNIGIVLRNKGEYDRALELYGRSLSIKEKIGDRQGIADSLNNIGRVHRSKGDLKKALELYRKSLSIYEVISNIQGVSTSLNNIGELLFDTGEMEQALEFHQRCLKVRKDLDNEWGIAQSLNHIGSILRNKCELDKALEYFENSLKIKEKIGDKPGIATSVTDIGNIYLDKGELDKALNFHKRSLDIKESIGDKKGVALSNDNVGLVLYHKGVMDEALDHFEKSLKIRKKIGDWWGVARALDNIGNLYIIRNEFDEALKVFKRSLDIDKNIGDKRYTVHTLCGLAHANLGVGNIQRAMELVEQSLDISLEIGAKAEEGLSRKVMSMIYREDGDLNKAQTELEITKEIMEEVGDKKQMAMLDHEYGLLLRAMGDEVEARKKIQEALSQFDAMGMKLWSERCVSFLQE